MPNTSAPQGASTNRKRTDKPRHKRGVKPALPQDRSGGDRPRGQRTDRADSRRGEYRRTDERRTEFGRAENRRDNDPRAERPRRDDSRTRGDGFSGRPSFRDGTSGEGRFRDSGSRDGGSRDGGFRGGRSRDEQPRDDRPRNDRFRADRSREDNRGRTDRPQRRERPDVRAGSRPVHAERTGTAQNDTTSLQSTVAEHVDATEPAGPLPSFAELGLPKDLVSALTGNGITGPFPIQAATLPDSITGRDVLGRGQTGSGKTLAFGLAILCRLAGGNARPGRPRGLVLVPTRELAMQVADELAPYAKALNLWCRVAVGGTSFPKQVDALRRGVDLLIATPGRLSDHIRQGTAALDQVIVTAVDEADQMSDMGFLPQVRELLDLTDPNGQRLLFSATLDGDVDTLVRTYLHDPVTHSVAPPSASVTTMEHHMLLLDAEHKQDVVNEVASREGRTIMFVRTKHHVDRLAKKLRSVGVHAAGLHGGKTQGARTRVLADFKEGHTPVLVATDVAARGIHVDDVGLVVHVDPPADAKGYLHRAGRTARAGQTGTVVTLVTRPQRKAVFSMAEDAGVHAQRTSVVPGHPELVRITSSRAPSGVPVAERVAPVSTPKPRTGGYRGQGGRRPFRGGPRQGGNR